MDLDELRAFLAVAEEGSIASGAKRLGVARSTLGRRLEALEARIGVPLLIHLPSGVQLTSHGEAMAATGFRVLAEAQALERHVRAAPATRPGEVRVWVSHNTHTQIRAMFTLALRQLLPGVRIDAWDDANPVARLAESGDFALHIGPDLPDGPWSARVLRRAALRLCAHPDYLATRGRPASLADLERLDLIHWYGPFSPHGTLPLRDGSAHVIDGVAGSSNLQVVDDAVHAGMGIGLVPRVKLPLETRSTVPEVLLPEVVGCDLVSWLVVPEGLSRRPGWDEILRMLTDMVGAIQDLD